MFNSQVLLDQVKFVRVMDAVAAGTTVQNGTGVSLAGFDGVVFVALLGTLTATQVTSLKAQQSDDDGSSDAYSDLEGTLVGPMADADSNQCLVLDVFRPGKEFVRPVLNRATANAVIDGIVAILYSRKDGIPTTQDAATIAFSEAHVTPDEGTA